MFIEGYKIENGIFIKRYVFKLNNNSSNDSRGLILNKKGKKKGCWNTDNLPEGGLLDEVVLHTSGGRGGSAISSRESMSMSGGSYSGAGGGSSTSNTNTDPTPCEMAFLARDVKSTKNGNQATGINPIPTELSGGWELNNSLNLSELVLTDSNSGFNSAVYQKLVNGQYQYM